MLSWDLVIIKFIQVNIYKGMYLDSLLDFLKKEDADFISMQEVTWGVQNLCQDKELNLFDYIKLKLNLFGVYNVDFNILEGVGSQGNVVLSRWPILDHTVVILKNQIDVSKKESDDPSFFPIGPRHLLSAKIKLENRFIHVISWHGAWTAPPADTRETLRQTRMVVDYLEGLKEPFIMGGDLNAIPQSKTINMLNKVAVNLMEGSGVIQTTHPTVHKIIPRGFLIDYVFTSFHFKLEKLVVPQVTISDHLPVVALLKF